jgi:hypothetical protein
MALPPLELFSLEGAALLPGGSFRLYSAFRFGNPWLARHASLEQHAVAGPLLSLCSIRIARSPSRQLRIEARDCSPHLNSYVRVAAQIPCTDFLRKAAPAHALPNSYATIQSNKCADVAQLVEQLIRNQQVIGSSPIVGSTPQRAFFSRFFLPAPPARTKSGTIYPRTFYCQINSCLLIHSGSWHNRCSAVPHRCSKCNSRQDPGMRDEYPRPGTNHGRWMSEQL